MFENLGNIGQLASGIGSIFGAFSTDKANKQNFRAQEQARQDAIANVNAGTVDPFGTTVGRPGGTGTPQKTEVFGPVKEATDIGAQNVLAQEKGKMPLVDAGANLRGQIAQNLPPLRTPLNLNQAKGIIDADNDRIKNAILNPAIQDATALAQRTRSGMSNAPNLIRQFQERILPQIQLGGEKEALALADKDWDRYATTGLNTAKSMSLDPRYAPVIPGTESIGSIAQANAMLPKPAVAQPSYGPASIGMGIGNVLQGMQADADYRQAQAENNRFQQALLSRLGDQGPARRYQTNLGIGFDPSYGGGL